MDSITIRRARVHNLKNINLEIPRNKITTLVGISGSGKSTIAHDIIYAESQRQYLESLSTYVARLLSHTDRPDVDEIKGISPAVLIEQRQLQGNPRSTVGTVTELYTYLRLLFSRQGSDKKLSAGHFSFNTPLGACEKCKGVGYEVTIEPESFIDYEKSLSQGAVDMTTFQPKGRYYNILKTMNRLDLDKPIKNYSKDELDFLLYSPKIDLKNNEQGFVQSYSWTGIINWIIGRTRDIRGISKRTIQRKGKTWIAVPCSKCKGDRLNQRALASTISGRNIAYYVALPLEKLVSKIQLIKTQVAKPLVGRISNEAQALVAVGLGYLDLNRSVDTLSAGEAQRLKLGRELGSELIEMTYILDEPSVGLHPRDIKKLISVIHGIRDSQNTVIVVEHDEEIIKASDRIIEIGPGAGVNGGELVFSGSVNDLIKSKKSLTGNYLSRKTEIYKQTQRRKSSETIPLRGVSKHNIHNLSVDIPKNLFVSITGVSGSGKSTLVQDILIPTIKDSVVAVDQSPVGATTRGNLATYIGAWNHIRKYLGEQWEVEPSLLSFNSKGACPTCKGAGFEVMDMHFLPDMRIKCDTCQGKKYRKDILKYKFRGKNISEILELTAKEAIAYFDENKIVEGMKLLLDVGLDYLQLGQTLDTLSGGEGQRLKLARHLQQKGKVYTLDEPTTGLHPYDIDRILRLLHQLVDNGNSVIVIEHNLDVIASSDWIIDMGPEGGNQGGRVIFEGTPEEIVKSAQSYTGKFLKMYLSSQ